LILFLQISFGDVADFVSEAVQASVQAVLGIIDSFASSFVRALGFLSGSIDTVAVSQTRQKTSLDGLFSHLWRVGFSGILGKIWAFITRLKDFLKRIFGPILCVIQAIIDYEEALYNQFIRPLLILLQRVRSALVLLRLLHVRWAGRLDARLARLESKLAGSLFAVLRELNSIRQTISLFIDPFGLFDQAKLLVSNLRSLPELWNALHVAQERPLAASELDARDRDKAIFRKGPYVASSDKPYFDALADRVAQELERITK